MRLSIAIAGVLLALALAPSLAHADFALTPDSFQVSSLDATGQPELRAGAHPDRLVTAFAFNTLTGGGADGNVKDMTIDLPSGLVGDPTAVPLCSRSAFTLGQCRAESQIGVMHATFAGANTIDFPLYDVAPRQGELAEFGFFALIFPIRLVIGLREDGDYGTQIQILDLPQNVPLTAGQVELWGVPADHQSGTTIPRKPLLTNPTSCDSPMTTVLHARSWQRPDDWISAATTTGPLTDCDGLAFEPSLGLTLDASTADTPSGMAVALTVPQDDSPDGRATSQIRDLSATLPGGLTLSPGLADGLAACDDIQFGIGSAIAPACPAASKVGTIALSTPLLDQPISGDIYFGRPAAGDPFRLFVAASARGVTLKLGGSLRPDPQTGRLTLSLDGLPALPFSQVTLRFKGGPRAPLATPLRCGASAVTATVDPYRGGAPAQLAVPIEISGWPDGRPCSRVAPFAPRFLGGSTPPLAGRSSTFSMTVSRDDGDQAIDRLSMTLPPGLSARLADVTRCPTTQAVRAACTAASRVGSVAIEAGAGADPIPLTGDAYLTGPHLGAPFGLALVLRAHVGPLDLGTVVTLAAMRLDPATAQVTIETDSLPAIVGGIPLRLRTLALDVDRRGFMLDPTSCTPTKVRATLTSIDAATSTTAVRYAVGGCRALRFAPTVAMSLGPRHDLRENGHPRLTIMLRSHLGQATVRSTTITLPRMLALDPAALATFCTLEQAQSGRCPRAAAVGTARIRTPLLQHTLTGFVFVVQPSVGVEPELWASVAGMGIRLSLRSTTSALTGKPVSSRFADLPDIPLSSFALTLGGGPRHVLTLTGGLCAGHAERHVVAVAALRGHNGALRSVRIRVGADPAC